MKIFHYSLAAMSLGFAIGTVSPANAQAAAPSPQAQVNPGTAVREGQTNNKMAKPAQRTLPASSPVTGRSSQERRQCDGGTGTTGKADAQRSLQTGDTRQVIAGSPTAPQRPSCDDR